MILGKLVQMIIGNELFCRMVNQEDSTLSLISIHDHFQRFTPSENSGTLRAGFEPAHEPEFGL